MSKRTPPNSTLPYPTKRITRKARLKPVNRERKKRRKDADEVYGSYYVRVANLGTCVLTRGTTILAVRHVCRHHYDRRPEAHHLKAVSTGGKDRENLVDCCHGAHDVLHDHSAMTVDRLYGLDLRAEAVRLWSEHGPESTEVGSE